VDASGSHSANCETTTVAFRQHCAWCFRHNGKTAETTAPGIKCGPLSGYGVIGQATTKVRHPSCYCLPEQNLVSANLMRSAMHAVQLVDLAAVLAFHGSALLYRQSLVPHEAMQAYWVSNRARFDRWNHELGEHRRLADEHRHHELSDWWRGNAGLIDEILLSEPLVRVAAALGMALDLSCEIEEISPVTQSVYVSHLDVRKRALQIIVGNRSAPMDEAVRLNRLRSSIERWSDTMLGYLMTSAGESTVAYAFDPPRTRAFAKDACYTSNSAGRDTTCWLLSAAMREALVRLSHDAAFHAESNRAIGDSILMTLRPDLFDSVGLLKSLWLHRLENGAEQTDRVLKQLSQSDLSGCDILTGFEVVRQGDFGRW
jgi:hypothetical protein